MGKNKLKSGTKRILIGSVPLIIFLSPLLFPFFAPSPAEASIKNVSDQRDRTILYALIRCLKEADSSDIKDRPTADDIDRENMEGISFSNESILEKDVAVGYEIDEGDGNADCGKMSLVRALRPIHKTPKWFFAQLYDIKHPIEDDGTLYYPLINDKFDKMPGILNREMGAYDLSIGRDEKLRRLATAFWVCAEPAPSPPDRETTTYGGKKYQLRDGAPNEVSVGYDLEADNGKFACNTLMNWGDKNEMAQALKENPSGSTPGSPGGAADAENPDNCEQGQFGLTWIICPIIDLGQSVSEEVFGTFLEPLLKDVPINTDQNNGGYAAWQSFRILANIVLVGAMLTLVYGMIRGGR